jgi:hypothetical protein
MEKVIFYSAGPLPDHYSTSISYFQNSPNPIFFLLFIPDFSLLPELMKNRAGMNGR